VPFTPLWSGVGMGGSTDHPHWGPATGYRGDPMRQTARQCGDRAGQGDPWRTLGRWSADRLTWLHRYNQCTYYTVCACGTALTNPATRHILYGTPYCRSSGDASSTVRTPSQRSSLTAAAYALRMLDFRQPLLSLSELLSASSFNLRVHSETNLLKLKWQQTQLDTKKIINLSKT